jgi:DNA polymerase IV (DinB-like DNA polymerase)
MFVSVDMDKYRAVSERVMGIMRRFMPHIEPASIDEAYGDLSGTGSYDEAEAHSRAMKEAIRTEERLTASVGIGPNKLIAKIASGMQKPDGLTVVPDEAAEAFLEPLSVRAIPGIGPKTQAALAKEGFATIRDLKRCSLEQMEQLFGKRGTDFYGNIRGLDDSPIEEHWQVKSIGEQETFHEDTRDAGLLCEALGALCHGVSERLHREGFHSFRTVVLTVRFGDFETKSRSHTLREPCGDDMTLKREALKLMMPFLDRRENPHSKKIRLLGVRVEKLQ